MIPQVLTVVYGAGTDIVDNQYWIITQINLLDQRSLGLVAAVLAQPCKSQSDLIRVR